MIATFLIILTVNVLVSDTTVTFDVIGGLNNSSTLICQQNASILCKIDGYAGYMSLEIGSLLVYECSGSNCKVIHSPPSNIYVSGNASIGLFSFTLTPVIMADNDHLFKCSDHKITKDVRVSVKDITTTTIFDKNLILVTSGCIASQLDVEFQWTTTNITFEDDQPYMMTDNLSTTNASCLNDSVCGAPLTFRIIQTLSVVETEGSERYFKVVASYPKLNYTETIFSRHTYKIGDSGPVGPNGALTPPEIVGIVVGSIAFVVIVIVIVVIFVLKKGKKCAGNGGDLKK